MSRKAKLTSWTVEELHRLLSYLYQTDRQLHTVMLLSVGHGLRVSEALGLTAENFVDGRIVFGRCKGSKSGNHRLLGNTNPVFDEQAALNEVLSVRSDGRVLFDICSRTVNRRLVRACAAVGIHRTAAHHHSAKHTCGKLMLPVLGLPALQTHLGHAEGKNTMVYAQTSQEEVDAKLEARTIERVTR
jgi:integrase